MGQTVGKRREKEKKGGEGQMKVEAVASRFVKKNKPDLHQGWSDLHRGKFW